jgi:hypothetical protein
MDQTSQETPLSCTLHRQSSVDRPSLGVGGMLRAPAHLGGIRVGFCANCRPDRVRDRAAAALAQRHHDALCERRETSVAGVARQGSENGVRICSVHVDLRRPTCSYLSILL